MDLPVVRVVVPGVSIHTTSFDSLDRHKRSGSRCLPSRDAVVSEVRWHWHLKMSYIYINRAHYKPVNLRIVRSTLKPLYNIPGMVCRRKRGVLLCYANHWWSSNICDMCVYFVIFRVMTFFFWLHTGIMKRLLFAQAQVLASNSFSNHHRASHKT